MTGAAAGNVFFLKEPSWRSQKAHCELPVGPEPFSAVGAGAQLTGGEAAWGGRAQQAALACGRGTWLRVEVQTFLCQVLC